jgi:hypothetical protein
MCVYRKMDPAVCVCVFGAGGDPKVIYLCLTAEPVRSSTATSVLYVPPFLHAEGNSESCSLICSEQVVAVLRSPFILSVAAQARLNTSRHLVACSRYSEPSL